MIELTAWERRRLAFIHRKAPASAQRHRRVLILASVGAALITALYVVLLFALKMQAHDLGLSLTEAFRLLGTPPRPLSAAEANLAGQCALAQMVGMAVVLALVAPATVWFAARDAALRTKLLARLRDLGELPPPDANENRTKSRA